MPKAIQFPKNMNVTQGTIFVGGVAEDYPRCRTFGLIITARCDATNDKVKTYNYLPIVPLDDWLHVDGLQIILDRLRSDSRNAMRNALRSVDLSPSILETEEPTRVLELGFKDQDRKTSTARLKFSDAVEKANKIDLILRKLKIDRPFADVVKLDAKSCDQLIKELVQQKLAGYYFLPDVETDGVEAGFVVMLREVRFIPRTVAECLMKGISTEEFEAMCQAEPYYRGRLVIQAGDVAMPVSMLISPHTEHLMQTFSTLFGRIGIPDTPTDYLHSLYEKQPSLRDAGA